MCNFERETNINICLYLYLYEVSMFHDLHYIFISPSDWLPSVLLELVEFLQFKVWIRQSHQDQERHQASVQWRGENGKLRTLECPDLMWGGKDFHNWHGNHRWVVRICGSTELAPGGQSCAPGTPHRHLALEPGTTSLLLEVGFKLSNSETFIIWPIAETGMLLPGKYSESKKKPESEKYEVRANLKDFVPEEENTDK